MSFWPGKSIDSYLVGNNNKLYCLIRYYSLEKYNQRFIESESNNCTYSSSTGNIWVNESDVIALSAEGLYEIIMSTKH